MRTVFRPICAIEATEVDDPDRTPLAALAHGARASVFALAAVRSRTLRLTATGEILGCRAVLRGDFADRSVPGIVAIEMAARVDQTLAAMPEVRAVHPTRGRRNLIAAFGADTPETLDVTVSRIRLIESVSRSGTNLCLSTRRG